jgi:hypothetical protein
VARPDCGPEIASPAAAAKFDRSRLRCCGTPQGRKIATNNFGIREMSDEALLSLRMTRTVDSQLAIIDQNYFPAYVALAQANIRSVEESAYVRRLLLAIAEPGDNAAKLGGGQQDLWHACARQ